VQAHLAEFRARGVGVAAVTQGTGVEATRLCRMMKLEVPCLGDPGRRAYRDFELRRDGWWNVTVAPFLEDAPLAFRRIRHASLRGSMMPHSDVLQLGGVAVIDRQGVVRWLYRSRKTDDLPATADVLAEIDRLGLSSRSTP
jgi:peroxiredoxin